LPSSTGGWSPATTATSATSPTTTPASATTTESGPVALAASSTYKYGGLNVVVNLPTDIPSASRPAMRLFSEFLQGVGRTMARNKLDPSLKDQASSAVVKDVQTAIVVESIQGSGSVIFTIDKVQSAANRITLVSGCADQSKLVQIRKDGSHFVAGAKDYPTLKMTANINRGTTGLRVTLFTFAAGSC
jgi:hypothetical protein